MSAHRCEQLREVALELALACWAVPSGPRRSSTSAARAARPTWPSSPKPAMRSRWWPRAGTAARFEHRARGARHRDRCRSRRRWIVVTAAVAAAVAILSITAVRVIDDAPPPTTSTAPAPATVVQARYGAPWWAPAPGRPGGMGLRPGGAMAYRWPSTTGSSPAPTTSACARRGGEHRGRSATWRSPATRMWAAMTQRRHRVREPHLAGRPRRIHRVRERSSRPTADALANRHSRSAGGPTSVGLTATSSCAAVSGSRGTTRSRTASVAIPHTAMAAYDLRPVHPFPQAGGRYAAKSRPHEADGRPCHAPRQVEPVRGATGLGGEQLGIERGEREAAARRCTTMAMVGVTQSRDRRRGRTPSGRRSRSGGR